MSTFSVRQQVAVIEVAALGPVVAAFRRAAVMMTAVGLPVKVLHRTYIPGEQSCVSVVDADDAATVMEMLRRAGSRSATVLPALAL